VGKGAETVMEMLRQSADLLGSAAPDHDVLVIWVSLRHGKPKEGDYQRREQPRHSHDPKPRSPGSAVLAHGGGRWHFCT
jgi:hypothetical protein